MNKYSTFFIVGNTFSKRDHTICTQSTWKIAAKRRLISDDILCHRVIVGISVIVVFMGGKTSSGRKKFMADWAFNVSLLFQTVVKLLEVNELHGTCLKKRV